MNTFIALLRAVNVGGTGKLPMAELRSLCDAAGFTRVRTCIASGNVVFQTSLPPARAKAALEAQLGKYSGRPMGVILRTPQELAAVVSGNPFPQAAGNRLIVLFFEEPVPGDALQNLRHQDTEELRSARREIYVHYGDGMGQSKLVIPAAAAATGRNMNTVRKLAEMASE